MRIGHGYDVHRFAEGRKLILGGVEVPWVKGLAGHSDADVLLHAVMDALLGAVASGDIGAMFPDTDPEYAGISSMYLLQRVRARVTELGYTVCNLDATLVAQRPKLANYLPKMCENIAQTLQIDCSQVNVKATTEEHLGFTGREEGMAAHAVCLLKRII